MDVALAAPGGRTVHVAGSPIRFAGEPPAPQRPPSAKGAEGVDILGEILGLSRERVAALRAQGIVGGGAA